MDIEELAAALDDNSGELKYYLDLETGEVVLVTEEVSATLDDIYQEVEEKTVEVEGEFGQQFDEVLAGLTPPQWLTQAVKEADRVESGFGVRYVSVPAAGRVPRYGGLHRHRGGRPLGRVAQRGHQREGRFPRFRDVLARCPKEEERWFQYQNARLR